MNQTELAQYGQIRQMTVGEFAPYQRTRLMNRRTRQMNPEELARYEQLLVMNPGDFVRYEQINQMNAEELAPYRPLYRAIREHNWKSVEDFVKNYPKSFDTDITEFRQTIFHLLTQFDDAVGLLEQFVSRVPPESLERENVDGHTALVIAAISGNTKGAEVLVRRHKKLLSIKYQEKYLPVHAAAYCSRKETVEYLISQTADAKEVDLNGKNGSRLLEILIWSNLFGGYP